MTENNICDSVTECNVHSSKLQKSKYLEDEKCYNLAKNNFVVDVTL